jgi:hypothetical protein
VERVAWSAAARKDKQRMRLSSALWIWSFAANFALMIVGGLIGCAELPVYRSGRFFTFGI